MKRALVVMVAAAVTLCGLAGFGEAQYPCVGNKFTDVNASIGIPFCGFIEEFANRGITSGCVADNPVTPGNEAAYCPDANVTRAQMAVFMTSAMDKVSQEPSNNQTRLLFPFVTNQVGFDTAIAIANTTVDPFGTTPASGSCRLYSYGANAPPPITSPVIAGGIVYSLLASVSLPNFQGYVIAVCNFPLAHGFYFLSDLGARNLGTSGHALVLPSTRTTTLVESRGN